jgi:hypothetical protein
VGVGPARPVGTDRAERSMSKPRKAVPDFADEAAERVFWETHDTADHVDWSTARPVRLPNLEPSTTAISLRLPVALLERISSPPTSAVCRTSR